MELLKQTSNLWLTEEIQDIYINNMKYNKEFREFEENRTKIQKTLMIKIQEYIKDVKKQREVLELLDQFDCMTNGSEGVSQEIIYKEALIRGISLISNKR